MGRRVLSLLLSVLLVAGVLVPMLVGPVYAASFDPWGAGWQYRKMVTVDHTKVASTLLSFPVLVDVVDSDLASKAQPDGDDVLFMDGVGVANQLDHEIESYTSATGHLVAWVRIPSLSSVVDTVFYMYYGNSGVGGQQNPTGVWDSSFMMVQHLKETSGTRYDSTSNHNDGTPSATGLTHVTGPANGADEFDGTSGKITTTDNPLDFGTDSFSYMFWFRNSAVNTRYVFDKKGYPLGEAYAGYKMGISTDTTKCYSASLGDGTSNVRLDTGSFGGGPGHCEGYGTNQWILFAVVIDRSAQKMSVYINGTNVREGSISTIGNTNSPYPLILGTRPDSSGNYFQGGMDEVRVQNVALGADWVATAYSSMGSPSSFVKPLGVEEEPSPTSGMLRAYSSPAVPTTVIVDNLRRDDWGLNWVKLAPGMYTVHFTDVPGFASPVDQAVSVSAGATTTVAGVFQQLGYLHVVTNPALPGTISVDGVARDDWGLWVPLTPGLHTVHFGDVAGYTAPADQQPTVVAGGTVTVTGNYVAGVNPGPTGFGMLRVTTSPAVVSTISVDGVARDDWGLNWVKLVPGEYTVHFSDVPGYTSPPDQSVTVTGDATTEVTGVFTELGYLHVTTNPAVPGTIYVDGVAMDDWGVWVSLPAGSYTISFGDVAGYVKPADQVAVVAAGSTTNVTGNYT